MTYKFDLHNHTSNSFDCEISPQKLIKIAKKRGVYGIGICDHDTFPDYNLYDYAKKHGIKLALGIEFSCNDVHILGYNLKLNKSDKSFISNKFDEFYKAHQNHGKSLINQLQSKGYDICVEDILRFSCKSFVTALDIFRYFSEYLGLYENWQETRKDFRNREVFDLTGKEKTFFDPYEIIQIIKQSRGIAIWAHPLLSKYKIEDYFNNFDPDDIFIESLYPYIENGLEFGSTNDQLREDIELKCKKFGFGLSGGSDSHFPIKCYNNGNPILPGDFGINSSKNSIIEKLF